MLLLGSGSPVFMTGYPSPFLKKAPDSDPIVDDLLIIHQPWGIAVNILMASPDAEKLNVIRTGAVRLGIMPMRPHGWLWFYEFGGVQRYAAPYTPALLAAGVDELTSLDKHATSRIALCVLDEDFIVRVVRRLDLPPGFGQLLQRLRDLAAQHEHEFSPEAWDAGWDHLLPDLWPDEDPFRHATIMTTIPPC
jgi:hypothetical protein